MRPSESRSLFPCAEPPEQHMVAAFLHRRACSDRAEKTFYIEYFLYNPALAQPEPGLVWNDPEKQKAGKRPSYCMVNAGFWGKEKGQLHRFSPEAR